MNFAYVPENEWVISDAVKGQRRNNLLSSIDYKTIINRIITNIVEVSCLSPEKCRGMPDYKRARVKLITDKAIIDLFHNSNSGYRAQYYVSPASGDKANQYALEKIVPLVLKELAKKKDFQWLQESLLGEDSKIWIHQGIWLRFRRKIDRNLLVPRWDRRSSKDKKERKLSVWSMLTPNEEKHLIVKGTWLNPQGNPMPEKYKPKSIKERSCHIHYTGFT